MEEEELQEQWSQREELAQEKRRDYRKTVLLQIVLLSSMLLTQDLMRLIGFPIPVSQLKAFFYLLSGVYLFFLWDMLRNFTRKRWLIRLVLGVLVATFGLLVLVDVIWGGTDRDNKDLRLLCHLSFLWVEVLVIGLAFRDLFKHSERDVDKLWGSACLFFMSGFTFAGVYFCILLKDPLAFGRAIPQDHWVLFESLYLSLTALVGLDNNAYPDCTKLVRNIILLEGAWSQLYMVLLIGRLLSKDEPS